jgi:hypothetical protein
LDVDKYPKNGYNNQPMETTSESLAQGQSKEEDKRIQTQTTKSRHKQIWSILSKAGNIGRTYNVAKCCAVIYESRRDINKSSSANDMTSDFTHPKEHVEPLTQFLGKRSTWNEQLLSERLSILEEACAPGFEASYNTTHSLAQLRIEVQALNTKVSISDHARAEREEEASKVARNLQEQITKLMKEVTELRDQVSLEKQHRECVTMISRTYALAAQELCNECSSKFTISKALADGARENK